MGHYIQELSSPLPLSLRWPYVVNGTLHPRTLFPPPPFLRWPYVVNGTLHPRTLFPPPPFPEVKEPTLSLPPPPPPPLEVIRYLYHSFSLMSLASTCPLPPPPPPSSLMSLASSCPLPPPPTFLSWPYAVSDIKIQALIFCLFPLPSLSHISPGFSSGLIQVKLHPVSMLAEVTEVSGNKNTVILFIFTAVCEHISPLKLLNHN